MARGIPWSCLVALCLGATSGGLGAWSPVNAPNPAAVAAVAAGELAEANAAWWGFDVEDSTEFLQAAIDSGAPKVVVPYVGAPWIVRPILLRGDLDLVFEPGVLILAKEGEFKGKGDSLFGVANAENLTIRGYGATLRMRKKDYQSEAYAKAEWRMTLSMVGCKNVVVEGLRLESSGGDGIYVGATAERPYCEDVVIRNVVCHDHHRQGISVITAKNLLIENCIMSGTDGTPPRAGIDLEPNNANEKMENVVVRNCVMEDNSGAGILVYFNPLSRETDPVSVLFENCYVKGGKDTGIGVGAIKDDGPQGTIEFRNCTVVGAAKGGIYVYDKSPDSARVRFVNCKWRDVGTAISKLLDKRTPLLLDLRRPSIASKLGGIDFENCYVYDEADRPALRVEPRKGEHAVYDLQGELYVCNPNGARMELNFEAVEVGLKARPLCPNQP